MMVHVLRIPHDGWFPVVVLNVADKVNSKMEMQLWVEIILFEPPWALSYTHSQHPFLLAKS